MLRHILSFILFSGSVFALTCGGVTTNSIKILQSKQRNLLSRQISYSSIRITPAYANVDLPSQDLDSFYNDIIGGAVNWFSKVLSIKRLSSALDISPLAGTSCGTYFINSTSTNLTYNNTDVLIFIDATSSNTGNLSSSEICAQEARLNYPLVGYFHLETTNLQNYSYEQIFSTVLHQFAHILAFNSDYFSEFLQENGEVYTYSQVVEEAYERNHTVYKVQTPNVVQTASLEFACADLDGVELENQGGAGIALNHWEKRIMNNDFMVADLLIKDISYSDITLALFEDSGWYQVNYSYTNNITWGSKSGCQFLLQDCVINQVATSDFFNTNNNTAQCDYNRLNRGTSNLKYYESPIPFYDQYFNSQYFGGDFYADYCPFIYPNIDGSCRGTSIESSANSDYGEILGEESRCFQGNYSLSGNTFWHVGCHTVQCFDSYVNVNVGGQIVTCAFTGGFVQIPGYEGFIDCYLSQDVCKVKPCMNACSGLGECFEGVCQCLNGTVDGDCREYSFGGNGQGTLSFGEMIGVSLGLIFLCIG